MAKVRPTFRAIPGLRMSTRPSPDSSQPGMSFEISVRGPAWQVGPTLALLKMSGYRLRTPSRSLLEVAIERSMSNEEFKRIQDFIIGMYRARATLETFAVSSSQVRSTLAAISKLNGREACVALYNADHVTRTLIKARTDIFGPPRLASSIVADPLKATDGFPPDVAEDFQAWIAADFPDDPAKYPLQVAVVLGRLIGRAAAAALQDYAGPPRGRPRDLQQMALAAECWRWWRLMKLPAPKVWRNSMGYVSPLVNFAQIVLSTYTGVPVDSSKAARLLKQVRGHVYRFHLIEDLAKVAKNDEEPISQGFRIDWVKYPEP